MLDLRNKRILFSLCLILSFITNTTAQNDSINVSKDCLTVNEDTIVKPTAYDEIMSLNPAPMWIRTQGGACYGDYYAVGVYDNSRINLYDLKKKAFVYSIPITEPQPSKNCHANTISFSNKFYKSTDVLPLLYVCSSFGDTISEKSHIYVYRITQNKDNTVFESHLVQDIFIDVIGWTECVVDNDHDAIWVKRYLKKSSIEFIKYTIPDISKSKTTLSKESIQEIISTYEIPIKTQGFLYYKDHIYCVVGVPSTHETCYFIDFNLNTKDYDRFISLYDIGLVNAQNQRDNKWEPENVFVYNDELYIGYHHCICRLNMELIEKEHNYKNLFERIYK